MFVMVLWLHDISGFQTGCIHWLGTKTKYVVLWRKMFSRDSRDYLWIVAMVCAMWRFQALIADRSSEVYQDAVAAAFTSRAPTLPVAVGVPVTASTPVAPGTPTAVGTAVSPGTAQASATGAEIRWNCWYFGCILIYVTSILQLSYTIKTATVASHLQNMSKSMKSYVCNNL